MMILKKAPKPADQLGLVNYAIVSHGASQRLVCRAVGLSRSDYRYLPDTARDDEVNSTLQATK